MDPPRGSGLEIACFDTSPEIHRLDSGIISWSSAGQRVTSLCQHIPGQDVMGSCMTLPSSLQTLTWPRFEFNLSLQGVTLMHLRVLTLDTNPLASCHAGLNGYGSA